jgi:hypothetical protein
MEWIARYVFSLLPLAFIGGAVFLAEWVFERFNCIVRGKNLLPCIAHGMDIAPLLGIGLFWCKLLLPVAWFISVPWFVYVAISHVQALRRNKRITRTP